jgi:L-histidine N-alpha-methyltransferase
MLVGQHGWLLETGKHGKSGARFLRPPDFRRRRIFVMSSQAGAGERKRLVIHRVAPEREENRLAEDVRAGLTAQPKTLPPKYFYDELGAHLFEAICQLPEYYLTRAESEILQRFAGEIVEQLSGHCSLVELGSGSAVKTRHLIAALLARQATLHYQPIDISAAMLEQSAQALLQEYPGLRITAQANDYTRGLGAIERGDAERLLVLFLGSNIGNYDPPEALALLREVRRVLRPGDGLLLGADLKKSAAALEAAYDDALGVTAAFNLNLLRRLNRELEADFDLAQFTHRASYNQMQGRVEIHLVSRAAQTIHLRGIGLSVELQAGEMIHTENSYKYDLAPMAALAQAAGFKHERAWLDAGQQFSCNLWLATA